MKSSVKKSVSKVVAGILGLSMAISLASCANSSKGASAKEILIGSIHPLTGSMAYEGNQIVNAQKMAVDEINKAGGIKALNGAKLKLVTGDSKGQADTAASETQRLIQQGVVALTGTYSSSTTQTATQTAEREKVPFVITVSAANSLMQRGFKYSFRIQPNTDTFAQNFIDYLDKIKTSDIKTMLVIHENSLYGTSIYTYLKAHNNTGVKIVDEIAYSASTTTLSSEATKIQSEKPDLLVCVGYTQDQTLLYKEITSRNLKFKGIIGVANGAFSDPSFIKTFGDSANNVMDINYHWNPNSKLAETMLSNYKSQYSDNMSPHAIYGYESVYVISNALEKAASTDRTKLRDALATASLSDTVLPQDSIKFGSTGEDENATAVLMQIQNGEEKVVYPSKYSNATLHFPNN